MTDPGNLPLRAMHLPPSPSWWPPAPGWWMVAGLCIAAAVAATWWRRRGRRLFACRQASRALEDLRREAASRPAVDVVRELSALLRRTAISFHPRRESAGLTGEAWLNFLDRDFAARRFASPRGRVLLDAPYRNEVSHDQIAPLFELCADWISAQSKRQRVEAP